MMDVSMYRMRHSIKCKRQSFFQCLCNLCYATDKGLQPFSLSQISSPRSVPDADELEQPAIDKVPVIPSLFEFIGILYSAQLLFQTVLSKARLGARRSEALAQTPQQQ
ncbi:hypothetical protein Droror1_Dr00020690 [Drosera rotundifolia]